LILVLRTICRRYSRRVIGNIERFRQSVLAIICPATRDDLIGVGSSAAVEHTSKPEYVWIAHRSLESSDCRRIVFYVHGGGFAKGDLAAFHRACSTFSRELNALVAFPLYELCPEQTIDRTVCRIKSTLREVRRQFRATEIVIMADSAGGLLATLLLQAMHVEQMAVPQALVLLSPLLDLELESGSVSENSTRDPVVDVRLLQWLCSLAKENADPDLISVEWTALGFFPPTYVVASVDELLRDDSRRLESALLKSDVQVRAVYWPGLPHAFPLLHQYLPEAREATSDINRWLDDNRTRHAAT
jgi:acetyl esterase/lipase